MNPSRKRPSQPSSAPNSPAASHQPELKAPPRLPTSTSEPKPPAPPVGTSPAFSNTDDVKTDMALSEKGIPSVEPVTIAPASTDIHPTDVAALYTARLHPIPPPSEPMQYRAIGLVRGRYSPSADQFSQGTLTITADGYSLPAVLLGRVLSLVKNHLNLEQDYRWVVYPRMFGKPRSPQSLTFQIMGVWEPALLNRLDDEKASETSEPSEPSEPSEQLTEATSPNWADPEDGYFSIRGEVIEFSEDSEDVTVNICQVPRKPNEEGKSFKLPLKGTLVGKVVGQFWDLDVHHDHGSLVIRHGSRVGLVAPKKRKDKPFSKPKAYRKPNSDFIPSRDQTSDRAGSQPRQEPFSKPIKKNRPVDDP